MTTIGGNMFYGMVAANATLRAAIASAAADTARTTSRSNQRVVRDLAKELDRLELVLEAQWSLLREKLGLTDADLKQRVRELDLEDGVLDGKITKEPVTPCPSCARMVARLALRCTYCGEPMAPQAL
jgi:hypothetical protein